MSYRPHPTHPGWYYVEYRPSGYKGKLERIPVDSLEKAIALDNALKAQKGKPADTSTHPRIKDVVDTYLEWVKGNQADETYQGKRRRFKYLKEYFGEYRVKDLMQTALDGYAKEHTRASYRVDLTHLMALIKWMQKRNLAPLLSFRPETVNIAKKVKRIPAPQDLLAVLAALKKDDHRALFGLMLYAGLRWSEARLLTWENVDLRAGIIRIAEAEYEQEDVIPIPEPVREWLEKNEKKAGWVFTSKKKPGTPYVNLDHALKYAADKVGIYIYPHLFRHASATLLYNATKDIYAVQHHLRHTKVTTSQIYTRYSIEHKRSGMNSLVELLFNSQNDEESQPPKG